jgi:secreted PhoX family phosphatase
VIARRHFLKGAAAAAAGAATRMVFAHPPMARAQTKGKVRLAYLQLG